MSSMQAGHGEPMDAQDVVHRFVAPNPGPKTLQGTNTYVVGSRSAYVLDPGPQDEGHLTDIAEWLRFTGRMARGILLTHGHPDHASGAAALSRLLGVPIWAADTAPYPLYAVPEHERLLVDTTMEVDGGVLRAISTPGHTPDSISYFLESEGVMFTGDTVLGYGSTIVAPPEGNMTEYMASLRRLQSVPARLLAPGHGPAVHEAEAKILEYIAHRNKRESELVNALAAGPSRVPALVARLYLDTAPELWELAEGSVTAGLQKLEREGVVERHGDSWSLPSLDRQ